MDIYNAIANARSKQHILAVRDAVVQHPVLMGDLWKAFTSEKPPLPQYAAWVLMHVYDAEPGFVIPYLDQLIDRLPNYVSQSERRCAFRILEKAPLPEKRLGELLDCAYGYFLDPGETVGMKYYSMGILWRICEKEPDLANELRAAIESQLPHGSAGIKKKAKRF